MSSEPKLAEPLIHPTAIVESGAEIGKNVRIGPHSWIRENVVIGDDCVIGANVVIEGWTTIGPGCTVYHSAVVGAPPQDLKYRGDRSYVEIGAHNAIREFVTINLATSPEGVTRIGDHNLLMAYVHVAHECEIGNHTIIANAVNLAGHVTVEDYATIGGVSPVHQFVRIGAHSFIGGGSRVAKDVPPFVLAAGNPLRVGGINVVGLTRRGFDSDVKSHLIRAYKILFRSDRNTSQAIAAIRAELPMTPEVERFVQFIESSERGII